MPSAAEPGGGEIAAARGIFHAPMRLKSLGLLIAACTACSSPREAPPAGTNQVVWTATSGAPREVPGTGFVVDVDVRATIEDGWHIYSLGQTTGGPVPLSVKVAPSPPYSLAGEPSGPPAEKAKDANFGIETETYSKNAVIRVPVKLSSTDATSAPPLEIKLRSQACSDRVCLPARTTTLVVKMNPDKS